LQEGILFHTLMDPGAGFYVDQLAVTLDLGDSPRPDRIEAVVSALVARHAVLRTGFVWEGQAEPLQVVAASASPNFTWHDWSSVDPQAARERVAALIADERSKGFDLERPPLLRAAAALLSDGAVELVVTYHHIILDAWSVARLFAEFQTLWSDSAALLRPPPSFRNYVRSLRGRVGDGAEGFWRERLSGLTGPTPLVAGDAPTSGGIDGSGVATLTLTKEDSDALTAAARSLAITPASLIHAAWARVLAIRAEVADIVFGVTLAGRPADLRGSDSLVGLCINTLPLRVAIDPGMRVSDWLRYVHARLAELRSHEFTPLAKVREWSGLRSGMPMFESVMAFENIPGLGNDEDAGEGRRPPVRDGRYLFRTNYPVNLLILPGDRLTLRIDYDRRRYEHAEIVQCIADFASVAVRLAREPEARLGSVGLIGAAEESAMAALWRGPDRPDAGATPVHFAVAAQAARDPDAIAVTDGSNDWSYAWVDGRANALAQGLIERGVGAEDRIAVHGDRSVDLVVALLAILKAGAVYVPLDPMYPAPRLAAMVAVARPRLVLCADSMRVTLPPLDCPVLTLDDPGTIGPPPRVEVSPDQAAYVIFTSGSSGAPKGIALAHRGLANMLADWNSTFAMAPHGRLLQFASISFDASLWEILSALSAGATLCIGSRATLYSAEDLIGALARLRITHALLPPSLLGNMDPGALPDLVCIAAIGERCTADIARRWSRGRRFFNAYGPAEGTITDCVYEHRIGSVGSDDDPPIGRPMANVSLYVLDGDGNPVPPGVPGELAIGGINVARGYIGRPGETATRFAPDPRGAGRGARMYLSGDRVVMRRDGALRFLGRADGQVKIRGTRVEIGEIEHALRAHGGVRDAVVVAREWPGVAEVRLVGYIVPADIGAPPSAPELRTFLRSRLAEAMVPATFVVLGALPISSNGKIDRPALPAPRWDRDGGIAAFRLPTAGLEERLAAIWRRVLKLERVGADDNYFDLGGDSIISIRLVAAAQREGIALSPRDIFEHQSIAKLVAVRGAELQDGAAEVGRAPQRTGVVEPLPMQARFLEWMGGPAAHYNQAVLLALDPEIAFEAVERALAALVARHDALRLRVASEGGRWRFAVGASVEDFALERCGVGEDVDVAIARLHASRDPAQGRMFGALWIDRSEAARGARLLLVAHHLAVDAVSWTILLGDFAVFVGGAKIASPAPSFAAAADSIRDSASAAGSGAREMWSAVLAGGTPAFASLAVDSEAEATTERAGRGAIARLTTMWTPADLILDALAAAGGAGGLIDIESNGRDAPCLAGRAGAVGWFTAIAPLRLTPTGTDPRLAAKARRATERDAWSYAALVQRDRALVGMPRVFLFNWLGEFRSRLPDDVPFRLALGDVGESRDPALPRPYAIELNAWIEDDALVLAWLHPATTEARSLVRAVTAHIDRWSEPGVREVQTPGSALPRAARERLMARLRAEGIAS
jgi:amino acid adenylation domain-containing protein